MVGTLVELREKLEEAKESYNRLVYTIAKGTKCEGLTNLTIHLNARKELKGASEVQRYIATVICYIETEGK